ncbi:VOC family protein [Actinomadura rubrisoli]
MQLDLITIVVDDYDRAIEFFTDALGSTWSRTPHH